MADEHWKSAFVKLLASKGIDVVQVNDPTFYLVKLNSGKVIVHLVSNRNDFTSEQLVHLSNHYDALAIRFVQLWEDVWLQKSKIVINRLSSFCGLNNRIHGRKTRLQVINKPIAENFLEENHLQGYASSRFKYGLFFGDVLVAVATFSSPRKMNYAQEYTSIELIRFALRRGTNVIGGLSKLIKGHFRLHPTDDLMSYIDIDWGRGAAFKKLGFKQTDLIQPQYFKLDGNFERQKPALSDTQSQLVFNSGSVKMILRF